MRLSIFQSSTCVRFWLNIHKTSVWMTFAVILITTTGDEVRKFLLAAQALGFTNGDYVFITVDLYRTAELGAFDWRYGKLYLRHDDMEMEMPGGNAWRITILCLLKRESTSHGWIPPTKGPSQWHHNERDCVSNRRRLDCSGAGQRKHQSSASLAFVRGIHRWPVNSPYKWPATRKMFPFDDVIISLVLCLWKQ